MSAHKVGVLVVTNKLHGVAGGGEEAKAGPGVSPLSVHLERQDSELFALNLAPMQSSQLSGWLE